MGPSPAYSAATARCTVTVDLPEPPFWFATTMVFIRKAPLFLKGGAEVGNHHRCAGATRLIRTYDEHTQQFYKNSRFLESENFPFDILTSRRRRPQAAMWCGRSVPSTALATSGACASRWLPADSSALPAAPGDIWKQRVRGGVKNRNARLPTGGLQPVGSAYHIAASHHRGLPGRR